MNILFPLKLFKCRLMMSLGTQRGSVACEKPGKAVKENWDLDFEKAWFHDEGKGQITISPKV